MIDENKQNNGFSNEIINSIMKGNGKIDIVGKVNQNNAVGLKNLKEGYSSIEFDEKK